MGNDDGFVLSDFLFGSIDPSAPWFTGVFLVGLVIIVQGLKVYGLFTTYAAGRLKARQSGAAAAQGIGPDDPDDLKRQLAKGKTLI